MNSVKLHKIPKIVHQIWLPGCDKIPSKFYENVQSIKNLSSDWDYKCWDEKELYDLCVKYDPLCGKLFKNYKRLNDKKMLAKYVILYTIGGVYLELDCSLLKSLDLIPGLNSKDVIISFTPREYVKNLILEGTLMRLLNTATIVSSSKNFYIKEIIDNIINSSKNNKIRHHESIILTKTLVKYKNDSKILLLDHKYLDPCHSLDSCCIIDKKAIVNHKHNLSWLNSRIAWLLGCVLHLKEDYDHLISCMFLLLLLVILITQLFQK